MREITDIDIESLRRTEKAITEITKILFDSKKFNHYEIGYILGQLDLKRTLISLGSDRETI
jgi:hypothetical protein